MVQVSLCISPAEIQPPAGKKEKSTDDSAAESTAAAADQIKQPDIVPEVKESNVQRDSTQGKNL